MNPSYLTEDQWALAVVAVVAAFGAFAAVVGQIKRGGRR